MIYDNVLLHNVEEIIPVDGGVRLQRIPENIRIQLNERAQERMRCARGMEIRFLSEDDTVKVRLMAENGRCEIIPFIGGFQTPAEYRISAGEEAVIELKYPDRLKQLDTSKLPAMPFSTRLWRLTLTGERVIYKGIESGTVRPPETQDQPKRKLLAYGTSITQGVFASRGHLSYISQTARRLGADVINLGTGGSAYCEPAIADHIASRNDWNICVLCISVNMVNQSFDISEFKQRANYMIQTIADAKPNYPLVCMSILPYFKEFPLLEQPSSELPQQFREALHEAVVESGRKNVHYVDGKDILQQMDGLSVDLIHPGDFGMMEIAERLANRIRKIIGDSEV